MIKQLIKANYVNEKKKYGGIPLKNKAYRDR